MSLRTDEFYNAVELFDWVKQEYDRVYALPAEQHPSKPDDWRRLDNQLRVVARGAALTLYHFARSAEEIKGLLAKVPSITNDITARDLTAFNSFFEAKFPNWPEMRLSTGPNANLTTHEVAGHPQPGVELTDSLRVRVGYYQVSWGGDTFLLELNKKSVEYLDESANLFFKIFDSRAGY